MVEPDAIPPSLCDPKDPGDCVDFCSRLTPECAVPWRTVPSCLLPTEQEFRREVFRRDTADRPEAFVQGRITDEAGHRVEGAKIRVWFQGTAILDEVSGKDGSFRVRLRAGPWTYSVRVSHAGLATEITDLHIDRAGTTLHNFRLAPESTIHGRVVSTAGEPIGGVAINAVRSPDDLVDAGETQSLSDGSFVISGLDVKRYFLRASKFGWLPQMLKCRGLRRPPRGFDSSWFAPPSSRGASSTPMGRGRRTRPSWRSLGRPGKRRLADHLGRRRRRKIRPGPVRARDVLPLGAAGRNAGLPAGKMRSATATSTRGSS